MKSLEANLKEQKIVHKYLGTNPPEFSRDKPSEYPVRVVIEIDREDEVGVFPTPGFYLFPDLSPQHAKAIFGDAIGPMRL